MYSRQYKINGILFILHWSFIHWTDGRRAEYSELLVGFNACWFTVLTLWRSESCWWRIRASFVGNCRRHSRQTIFFQSVIFPSSSTVLSEPPSSGSLSPLWAATTPLWDMKTDNRWSVGGFIFHSELWNGNIKAKAQTNLSWNVLLCDLELFGHEWWHLKASHLLKGSNKSNYYDTYKMLVMES